MRSFSFSVLLLIGLAGPFSGVAAETVTPTQCGPGDSGAPCGGDGPASQGNSSDTDQGAGNPINVITGNKYQQETDLPALPGVLGLEIVRHYNSVQSGPRTPPGILGRGWRLSYETDLYVIGNTLQIVQADGTRIIFIRDPKNPSLCATHNPAHGRLAISKTPRGDEYRWTWINGRTLSFNHQGRLTEIRAPSGEFVSLTRDFAGALVKVTDPQGRSLILGYPQRKHPDRFNGVTHIQSPVGRFSYTYGSAVPTGSASGSAAPSRAAANGASINPRDLLANLVRVDLPGATHRHYHYEDPAHPTLLTGISVTGQAAAQGAQPQRLSTWAYDAQGRGILSVKGTPKQIGKDGKPVPGTGIEQVSLVYAPGKTTLTNSLDQTTTYTHAIVGNEHRLLTVTGAGCASCGETNVRYGYDKLGRLTQTTKLSPTGQPLATLQTQRDTLGRPIRIDSIAYQKGQAQPAKLQVRYEYGQGNQPTLIARPSVIPGKETITRITYNPAGQPIQITESGFSPAISISASITGKEIGREGQSATPISRITTYSYSTINGRSLLTQIDGPLANGKTNSPVDSDITRLEWDRRGSAVVMMAPPGGFSSTVQYDAAGRIAEVSNAENFKTTFTYDAANQLIQTASSGQNWEKAGIKPVVHSYRYDALSQMIETGIGGSTSAADKAARHVASYRPQTRQAYDIAGRLLWQAEALGILKRARYDTEGNLLSSTVQTRSFEQTEQYRYDAFNRLIQVTDNTGSLRNIVYGKNPQAKRPTKQSAFQVLKDDFGREVMIASASHGITIKRYNAANQLVQQRSDKGDIQAYAYDLTGQRIRHTIKPKTGESETTTWRYQQRRLVEVAGPVQTERIRYNERGQPEAKTVTLKLANGAQATHITRYSYTANGSLQSQSLPDGTKILYERNGQGQVVAVSQQTSPWTIFGWGKTILVKDLQRDLIGLRHVTYGNGIQGQWQRSKEGVLARVVYTQPEGRAANPSSVVASQAVINQIGSIMGKVLSAAHAQTPAPAPSPLPGALGLPTDPQALFDARLLYDGAGNVLLQQQQGQGRQHTQAYAYDRQSQLVAAQSASPSSPVIATATTGEARVWRYHYDQNGNRVLAQENVAVTEMGHTRKVSYDLASNAMLNPALDREYVWNAQGQLIAIRQENRELARYRYNHHGLRVGKQTSSDSTHNLYNEQRQRIADLDANGGIIRQYLWLGDHLIATLDARQPKPLQASADGFWQELTQTAEALWSSINGNTDRLAFVHVNHLGAPVAATDQAGQIIWQADYAPYGKVIRTSTSESNRATYTLALRLPGQWEDSESGLYYNDFRYYDPQSGRYLSPDPLGRMAEALGSPNAYAYVNNNPLSYIDPWGLILFAFDGTGNSNNPAPDDLSNVYKFYFDLYNDGEAFYITGVGTKDPESGIENPWYKGGNTADMAKSLTGKERIAYMIQKFQGYAKTAKEETIDIDVIGFSRGAAQGRDFVNQLVANTQNGIYSFKDSDGKQICHKVNFRFMGLWDTVLSTHTGSYNLAIPNSVKYVAHAVAVNEHRKLFPGESIYSSPSSASSSTGIRNEVGFIGAHSDIGGGYGEGDLSDVALNWIYQQAKFAGVKLAPLPPAYKTVSSPIWHDSNTKTVGSGFDDAGDRKYRYQGGKWYNQKIAPVLGMNYSSSLPFLQQYPTPQTDAHGNKVLRGTIDMKGYSAWLKTNYGLDLAY